MLSPAELDEYLSEVYGPEAKDVWLAQYNRADQEGRSELERYLAAVVDGVFL